jgi:nucleotide-binding universal stress UspA family protein
MRMERERIVVGVDGSAGSQEALRWALREARQRGANVEIVNCWALPYLAMSSGYALPFITEEEISAEGHAHIDRTMAECGDDIEACKSSGVDVSTAVLQGDAWASLIEESKGASLLVVGRRGHGGLSRLVLGSVSRQVATHAQCPVVVVPETS